MSGRSWSRGDWHYAGGRGAGTMAPGLRGLLLGAVFAAALLARVGYVATGSPLAASGPVGDEVSYDLLARGLVQTGVLGAEGEPSAQREPGYPLFLAAVYGLRGPDLRAALLAQALLGALSCVLALWLAERLFGTRAGLIAGAWSAVYPPLIYFNGRLLRETLVVALVLLLVLAALPVFAGRPGRRAAILLGLAGAAAALSASTLLVVFALLLAALARRRRGAAITAAVAAMLLYAPWVARNAALFGAFVPGSTNGGKTFWDGTDRIPYEVRGLPAESALAALDADLRAASAIPREVDRDRFFYRKAAAYYGQDPGRAAALALRRLAKFWRLAPYGGRDHGHARLPVAVVGALSFAPALLLGAAGAFLLPRPARVPLLAPFVGLTLAHVVYWAEVRYRLPLEPLLIVLGSGALAALLGGRRISGGGGTAAR